MQYLFVGRRKHAEEVQACHIGKIRYIPYYFHQTDSEVSSQISALLATASTIQS